MRGAVIDCNQRDLHRQRGEHCIDLLGELMKGSPVVINRRDDGDIFFVLGLEMEKRARVVLNKLKKINAIETTKVMAET